MTKKLHPLLTEDENGIKQNQHYDQEDKTGIEILENKYTVDEMIAFCRVNIDKYTMRQDHKGQLESDKAKISKYRDYLEELLSLISKSYTMKYITVEQAFKLLNKNWRY